MWLARDWTWRREGRWYCECYGGPDDPDESFVDGAVGEAEVEEEDGEADEGGVPELESGGVSYRPL